MILKAKIIRYVLDPWIISLIISLTIYLLLPVKIDKYTLTLKAKEKRGKFQLAFYDLDKDGNSERIQLYEDFIGKVGIIVYAGDRVLNQWNFNKRFNGDLTSHFGFTYEDIDHDGIDEILLATFTGGDILLHCINPVKDEIVFRDKKIGSYTLTDGNLNSNVLFAKGYDSNHDGLSEIYFAFQSTFSIWPRGMNVYDYANDTIIRSPVSCNLMAQPMGAIDLDKDGVVEYYCSSGAVGNCDSNDLYTDHYSWLMAFTPEMKFKFEPVKTGIYPSNFLVQSCEFDDEKYLAGLNKYMGNKKSPCYIALYNAQGKIYKKTELEFTADAGPESVTLLPQTIPDIISVLDKRGNITNYNEELKVVSTLNIGAIQPRPEIMVDAKCDGELEYVLVSKTGDKLILAASDFSSVTEIKSDELISLQNCSVKYSREEAPELFIQSENFNYTFLYKTNPYFPFRILLLPAIYLVILGGISLLSGIQKFRLEQKHLMEKQLLEFQIKSVKNQLDPHFTLNLIASIGDLFDKKDSETSKYVFSKYSTLLRQSVLNADQYEVSLEQEFEFVENYLKLEKFRLNNKFDFEIIKNKMNRPVSVPKMLIHSFVENAVRHGIRYITEQGKIEISARMLDSTCLICIKDNGVGRDKSKQMTKFSTGKGLSIIDMIIKYYNDLKKTGISYRINDLKDEKGDALGTEVILKVPV